MNAKVAACEPGLPVTVKMWVYCMCEPIDNTD